MRLSTAVLALSCALATITGCTSSKSSPERHAYAFVAHRSDFVGGNFTVNRQENYRLNLPTFTAMYARGQQDKAAGMNPPHRGRHQTAGGAGHPHRARLHR